MEHTKTKLSITLVPELVRAVDRAAKRNPGLSRSSVIEEWLRRAAHMDLEERLRAETVAYYDGLSTEQRRKDAAIARASARAARRLELDDK
jgi:metal-responsive CopG/Arc/MetJ family transcriptional regulator